MIYHPNAERGSYWGAAFGLSVVVHAAGFALAFDLLPDWGGNAPPPLPPEISISSIVVEETTLAALAPEPAALPVETPLPDPAETAQPEPEQPSPEAPEPLLAEPLSPEPLAPETLSPLLPEEGEVLQGTKLAPVQLAPVQREVTTAALVPADRLEPTRPATPQPVAVAPPPPPTAEESALRELIDRIRNHFGDPCLIALPQSRGATVDPLVVMLSDSDRSMNTFSGQVLTDPDLPVEGQSILIDARQCPAVNFARERPSYPAFQLGLTLRSTDVTSGGTLVGTIDNAAGAYTTLLLIDDNGVVQDLRRFTRFVSGRAEFDIPVTRDGSARDTSQILMAIATPGRPRSVGQFAGRLAEDFFGPLKAELGPRARIAVVPFFVR